MSKILISPLGTGTYSNKTPDRNYRVAKYCFEEKGTIYETPFMSAAISEYLDIDRVFLVGTQKSMWETVYEYYSKKTNSQFDEEYWYKLAGSIEEFNNNNNNTSIDKLELNRIERVIDQFINNISDRSSKCFIIDYGMNEEELWRNFDIFMKIFDCLEDGDEIYLDITHSFRSIPLFMYLMMNFATTLHKKNIELVSVYYGMFEVKNDLGHVPVVDLSPLFKISEWIRGVYDFLNYGNGYIISNLIEDNKISKNLENISDLLNINYLNGLKQQIKALDKNMKNIDKLNSPVFKYLFNDIIQFVNRFKNIKSDALFQLEISSWYFENRRYSNGYICLVESIITFMCEINNFEINKFNKNRAKEMLFDKANDSEDIEELKYIFNAINKIRIDIAHATGPGDRSASNIKYAKEKYYYDKVKKIFKSKKYHLE